ncbi:MAG: hypothetical protein LPK25_03045 [Cyclobacteriaceae bacterium]|nr:hypothetical protein [Cyclobacteriaceae bacterium]MDX5465768.1 hypothetical protein [Cyclobacteriaceae bacterium]
MKIIPQISLSLLLSAGILSSCSTNKMAMNGAQDNLYFMASDARIATQYAVENNTPKTFESLSQSPSQLQENFSSRNVNPEYISRYQTSTAPEESGTVYFDEGQVNQSSANINAYDNYYSSANGNSNSSPNINFNFGLGFGFSPFGWGMSPYMGFGWGYPLGFNMSLGFGWGYPMFPSWGYPMYGWGYPGYGWGYPMYGWGYPVYPVYPGYPSYILPGGEYGNRRVVYGARPTRGSSVAGVGTSARQAALTPSTTRAQNRATATGLNPSARRVVASENSRTASRDFGSSQNDYYNSGRSRVSTTRNVNSAAADRSSYTRSRSSIPSARPSSSYPSLDSRTYSSPSRGGRSTYDSFRGTSPSYNRSASPSYNRSTSPSYNRSTAPTYNRSVAPSRSNSNSGGFSAPSRSSSGGGGMSAPSRSSGGSSGSSSGGSRGGRGN